MFRDGAHGSGFDSRRLRHLTARNQGHFSGAPEPGRVVLPKCVLGVCAEAQPAEAERRERLACKAMGHSGVSFFPLYYGTHPFSHDLAAACRSVVPPLRLERPLPLEMEPGAALLVGGRGGTTLTLRGRFSWKGWRPLLQQHRSPRVVGPDGGTLLLGRKMRACSAISESHSRARGTVSIP